MTYSMLYAHSNNDIPGSLVMDATTDEEAVKAVKKFVSDGYRNGTWASVDFANGSVYVCNNRYGEAKGAMLEPLI